MSTDLAELALESIVRPGVAPACAVALAFRAGTEWHYASAAAGVRSPSLAARVRADSPFDLASITKPFVAAALARLAEQQVLSLHHELGALLPEARETACARCPLEWLLAHRAGLEAHLALYAPMTSGRPFEVARALRCAASARRSDCASEPSTAGFPPVYSDLGYILAGSAAERVLAVPLDALVWKHVALPLGLDVGSARQWLARDADFLDSVVPTEVVLARGGELVGVVHDDNAWALSGHALAGHAGLFGSALPVAKFGAALIDAVKGRRDDWLDRSSAEFLTRERPGGSLRAGFDGKSATDSSAGDCAGPRTFGHLGFTGTSFWCDPDAERVAVLLTNRVRNGCDRTGIRAARPKVHDLLFSLARASNEIKAEGSEPAS